MNWPALAERRGREATPPTDAWATLIEGLTDAVWLVEPAQMRVVAVNRAALELLGRKREDVLDSPANSVLGAPEDSLFWAEAARGRAGELHSTTVLSRPDTSVAHVERRITRLDRDGVVCFMVCLRDQTHERRAQEERETLLAELRATLESTADGILVTDLAGRIRAFNRRFAQLWAMPDDLLNGQNDAAVFDWMRRSVVEAGDYQRRLAEIQEATLLSSTERLVLHSGQVFERVTLPQWSQGRPLGRVWSFRDLSERIAADQRIETLSSTDALTGLPHRPHLVARLAQALHQSRRDGDGFALLLLDMDRFKHVNDSLGHHIGDQVLVEVGTRIGACLREGDVMARIGGDQFGVLIHHCDAHSAERAAQRVLDAGSRPYSFGGALFTLTCSIGVALHPNDGDHPDELLRRAEAAMQRAKEGGRAGFRFHHARREEGNLRTRMRLDHAMRQALADGHMVLHYQPQVAMASGRVVGAEALIRWHDPELGQVSPAEFIPVAEDSGFIVAIGDWVLARAVRQAAAWRAQGLDMPVSINVSALQFRQADFVERVAAALQDAGLPPDRLELELTESILVRDADEALTRLRALAQLGVRLAIDDFGTGYSSLAYLKRFPIERLKIDRSFVRGLPGDESDAGIVRAIVQMARALGMHVVAEGVETEAQRSFLAQAGCDSFQGFLHAPALDVASFTQRVTAA